MESAEECFLFEEWEAVPTSSRDCVFNAKRHLLGRRAMVVHPSLLPSALTGVRFGRDTFQEAMKIANRVDPKGIDWARLKYMVFDLPKHGGTYGERYTGIGELFCPQCL